MDDRVDVDQSARTDADEEWTAAQCAALWGVKPKTWLIYERQGNAPERKRTVGRTPVWDAAVVLAYVRPGQGARTDLRDKPDAAGRRRRRRRR